MVKVFLSVIIIIILSESRYDWIELHVKETVNKTCFSTCVLFITFNDSLRRRKISRTTKKNCLNNQDLFNRKQTEPKKRNEKWKFTFCIHTHTSIIIKTMRIIRNQWERRWRRKKTQPTGWLMVNIMDIFLQEENIWMNKRRMQWTWTLLKDLCCLLLVLY